MALTQGELRLIDLVVAIVQGDWERLAALRRGAGPGEPDRRWREAVLQTHLFAGFPRVVEAWGVLESAGGLGTPEAGEDRGEPDRPAEGGELFDRIYAETAPTVRANLAGYHPDLARWILGHAYGRVLARPGLAPDRRELLAVACLAAQGQDRQLASHARGALRCGASRAELDETLGTLREHLPGPELERARAVVHRLT